MELVNQNGPEAVTEAILMELSEGWETGKRYLNMNVENEEPALQQNRIYRKNVA